MNEVATTPAVVEDCGIRGIALAGRLIYPHASAARTSVGVPEYVAASGTTADPHADRMMVSLAGDSEVRPLRTNTFTPGAQPAATVVAGGVGLRGRRGTEDQRTA